MVTNTPTGFSVLFAEETLVPLEFYYKPRYSSVQVLFSNVHNLRNPEV
jgi:hypothetical protein